MKQQKASESEPVQNLATSQVQTHGLSLGMLLAISSFTGILVLFQNCARH